MFFTPRVIKNENDTAQSYYTQTKIPWPISNRDLIFRSALKQDTLSYVITTNSRCMPGLLEEKDGVVRIKKGQTSWTLTPVKGGFVDVIYYASLDPGGSVPAWLINSTIDFGPLNTLQKVRELLEGGKYKDAQFWFVKEMK